MCKFLSFIVLVVILFWSSHCMASASLSRYYYVYDIELSSIENRLSANQNVSKNLFSSDVYEISFKLSNIMFQLNIKNKGEQNLTIVWQESYLATEGVITPIYASIAYNTSGVSGDLNAYTTSQESSILSPNAKPLFHIIESDNAYWQKYSGSDKGFWKTDKARWGLTTDQSLTKEKMVEHANQILGSQMSLHLMLEFEGKREPTTFHFSPVKAHIEKIDW